MKKRGKREKEEETKRNRSSGREKKMGKRVEGEKSPSTKVRRMAIERREK